MTGLNKFGVGGLEAGNIADRYIGYIGVVCVCIDVVLVVVFGTPEGGIGQ